MVLMIVMNIFGSFNRAAELFWLDAVVKDRRSIPVILFLRRRGIKLPLVKVLWACFWLRITF